MEGGNGDEVGFIEFGNSEEGVTDLFDVDCTGERGFLRIVALELEGEER